MKTTLDLPDDLIREMKLRAVIQGRALRDLVADLLRQGLGLAAPKPGVVPPPGSMVQTAANGLPIIACGPGAPTSGMTPQELIQLEQAAQTVEDMRHAGLPV